MSARPAEHTTHITPLRVYLGIGATLLFLTGLTVWVSTIPLGEWNVIVALAIATVKASLVAFFFMHLYYDNKLYFLVFTAGILFLALFIGFTMVDTMRRDDLDPEVGKPIRDQAAMYDSLAAQPAMHGEHEGEPAAGQTDSSATPDSAAMHADSTAVPASGH